MAKLPDGTEVDVQGKPRLLNHGGKLYVIGHGWLVSISDEKEAEDVIKRILKEPPCSLEQDTG